MPGKPDRTGGIALELFTHYPSNQATLYKVDRDGTIHFGGGFDAISGSTTWSGPMTDQEIGAMRTLLERHGWFQAAPESTGEPRDLRRRFLIRRDNRTRAYRLKGEVPALVEVETMLKPIAERRLDPILDALPKAGLQ